MNEPTDFPSAELARQFQAETTGLLDAGQVKIHHCLEQLTDEEIWWRPQESMNSIGNLLLHVCGNLTQWASSGIDGQPDRRQRQQEFDQRDPIARSELVSLLERTLDDTRGLIARTTGQSLLETRRIQGFEVTVMGALLHTASHLVGHTHQIIYITRLLKKDDYQFEWSPQRDSSDLPL